MFSHCYFLIFITLPCLNKSVKKKSHNVTSKNNTGNLNFSKQGVGYEACVMCKKTVRKFIYTHPCVRFD